MDWANYVKQRWVNANKECFSPLIIDETTKTSTNCNTELIQSAALFCTI
jgi:hypothetical protein